MIPNPDRRLHAAYDLRASPDSFPLRTAVVAFDDEGYALVPDPNSAKLVRAAEVSGFRFLEYYDQPLVFPAPPGWVVPELRDDSIELPVIAFVSDSPERVDPVFIAQDGTVMWQPFDTGRSRSAARTRLHPTSRIDGWHNDGGASPGAVCSASSCHCTRR